MVDDNQSQPARIEAVRLGLAESMDVIILSPALDSGWEEVLCEARNVAGTPAIERKKGFEMLLEELHAYTPGGLWKRGLHLRRGQKVVEDYLAKDAVQAIIDGKMNCVVECSPLLGPQLMKAVVDLMDGKELPLRIITDETDEIVFTAENAGQEVKMRKY